MRRIREHLDATLNIQVTQSCKEAIERIADEEMTTPSILVRQAILEYMRARYPQYDSYIAQYAPPRIETYYLKDEKGETNT